MNPSTSEAVIIVDEMIRGGVKDVVLCPGSRNAPLAFALEAADSAHRLRLHVRIDERTAGFLAIGLAATGSPVPVVVTSGTAVANLCPAVLEANYAQIPLIVLSANRPYELVGKGASQTIEQLGLLGTQVRATIGLALAEPGAHQSRSWRSSICRVLAAARGDRTGYPGPVHLDVPLREPLVPDNDDLDSESLGRPKGTPWTSVPRIAHDAPVPIDLTLDTVVIAGHGSGSHPELASLPTVAEPTAPLSGRPLHPLALAVVQPCQVIVTGRPTLHRAVARLLADPQLAVYVLDSSPQWTDVSGNARATGTRAAVSGSPRQAWLDECNVATARADTAVREQLAACAKPTGLHVAAAVMGALSAGDQLVLGASNPIRDASLVSYPKSGVAVMSNRGVAGIDGTVSTAVGAALRHAGRTLALVGDLTFLHDDSGLIIGPREPRPDNLTIVVANDDGGGIFELLEQGSPQYSEAFERIFGTPHRTVLSELCTSHGIAHQLLDLQDLPNVLSQNAVGIRLVEVTTDRTSLRDLHKAIKAAL